MCEKPNIHEIVKKNTRINLTQERSHLNGNEFIRIEQSKI